MCSLFGKLSRYRPLHSRTICFSSQCHLSSFATARSLFIVCGYCSCGKCHRFFLVLSAISKILSKSKNFAYWSLFIISPITRWFQKRTLALPVEWIYSVVVCRLSSMFGDVGHYCTFLNGKFCHSAYLAQLFSSTTFIG